MSTKYESTNTKSNFRIESYKKGKMDFIKVSNDFFSITFSNLGASIYQIKFGEDIMTLTPKFYNDFAKNSAYYGKTIGPIANRIKDAELFIDGKSYKLEKNEGNNCLHSGSLGFENRYFKSVIIQDKTSCTVEYHYVAPDLEGGFPARKDVLVRYHIIKQNYLLMHISYEVKVDRPTFLRLTNHTYYSLGEDSIENLNLVLNNKEYILPGKDDLLPIKVLPVPKEMSFFNGKNLAEVASIPELREQRCKGLDHYFYCGSIDDNIFKLVDLALLGTKYELTMSTDFKGVQIYTDNYADGIVMKNQKRKDWRGVAIEPGDSHMENILTLPDKPYFRAIVLSIRKR